LDYRWRKSVACIGNLSHSTTNTGRQADRRVDVTMPFSCSATTQKNLKMRPTGFLELCLHQEMDWQHYVDGDTMTPKLRMLLVSVLTLHNGVCE
jgi:hypothetical protein